MAATALIVGFDIGFEPQGGLNVLMLAVVAMMIGGRLSFAGPVVAGVLLGLMRVLSVWYLSNRWQEAMTFLVLAVFLLFMPGGLFGRKTRLEADE